MVRGDAMAKSLHSKDVSTFWKNVSKTYKKGVPIANVVNGANSPSSICDMWKVGEIFDKTSVQLGVKLTEK